MAVGASEVRGHWRLIDQLVVPRPVTHLFLVVSGFALAQLAWVRLSSDLLTYFAGVLGPFCLLCAGAVWGMRDKLDAVIDEESMDASTYRRAVDTAQIGRQRFMWKAVRVTVCALMAASPAISKQLTGDIWHWMVLMAGLGVGDAAFAYLLANSWEEQIRAFKAARVVAKKRKDEQIALEERIVSSAKSGASISPSGAWSHTTDNNWK
jgi:hypothetical protein